MYDTLAEEQADMLEINSAQLRRFFGEIKDLYRQFNSLTAGKTDDSERAQVYRERIEPRFKLIRSKVAYAKRSGGQSQLKREFAEFLEQDIASVSDHRQFAKFVTHLEAVIGFMYGKGKVR